MGENETRRIIDDIKQDKYIQKIEMNDKIKYSKNNMRYTQLIGHI